MTIKKQFLTILIILTLIPFVLVPYVGYLYVKANLEKQLMLQSEQNLNQIAKDSEQILDDLIECSNTINMNQTIIDAMKDPKEITGIIDVTQELSNINASLLYTYNAGISLYLPNGNNYASTGLSDISVDHEEKNKWIQTAINENGYFVWNFYFNSKADDNSTLCMMRSIKDSENNTVGVLSIDLLPDRKINQLLKNDNEFQNTERYIIDREGKVIFQYQESKGEEIVYSNNFYNEILKPMGNEPVIRTMYQKENYVISYQSISKNQWSIVQIVPYKDMIKSITYFRNITIAIDLLFLCIIIAVDVLVINRITSSITKLKNSMRKVRNGDFVTMEVLNSNQEVLELSKEFNHMTAKLQDLFQENTRIYEEKQRTKLVALQAQIQPHFLFNTLNGIKWLCIMEGSKKAEEMLVSLGRILEYSLGRDDDVATLEQEADCLEHYVILQKMRYGDIFTFELLLDEEAKNCKVPILFLQPLIENSILHGMEGCNEGGFIKVTATTYEEYIEIIVADNGSGMTENEIIEIFNVNEKNVGMGIRNVGERIDIYYNITGSIHMSINEWGGITTQIKIPYLI